MPPATPLIELDRLVELIDAHPEGLGIAQLAVAMGPGLTRRTLQRRLALLIAQGRIRPQGDARAVRYLPALPVIHGSFQGTLAPITLQATAEVYVPISDEAESIKAAVRQPRQQRQPIGYRQEFLEQYQPNQSAYLDPALRVQLHAMGRARAEQVPAGTFARDILGRLLIDLSWASSRLEGNTYSRLDTERLIEFGQVAEGKDALETQMILNHKQAIEFLIQGSEPAALSADTLIALHALLSDGLMADPGACGRLRNRPVDISGSVFLPLALPQRIEDLFGIVVRMAAEIHDPFEQAFFLMVQLPYLQPFEDINKRVSRLAANIPFIRHNLCPLSFIDVPQAAYVDGILGVYELNRVELLRDVFVWAYERSCQQYVAIQQALVPPDLMRLRYRKALSSVVADIVRSHAAATPMEVAARMSAEVADADREPFVAMVLAEFRNLHAGNAIRFGLRPLEFASWRARHAGR